jgi:MFS family permease
LLQPTIPAITNDLAPDHLRGRYNAVNSGAFQAGTILGPVVAGIVLGHHWGSAFIVLLVLGCAAMAALALLVERRISPAVNGVTGAAAPAQPAEGLVPGAMPQVPVHD